MEEEIRDLVKEISEKYGFKIKPKKLADKTGIKFEIDLPIFKANQLVALIDVKYLRYKKHARDKGSWIVVAHNRLRATFPKDVWSFCSEQGGVKL